jgi:hypothetical protein
MEGEKLLLGQKELKRWHLIKIVGAGKITLREAVGRWGLPLTFDKI